MIETKSPKYLPTPNIQHEITFLADLTGKLNGEAILLSGRGTIDEESGLTDGRYDIRRLPGDVDPRSLGAFLMTGYPNSCATQGADVGNPFAGDGYHYSRYYVFSSGEEAQLEMQCELSSESNLTSHFEVSGSVPSLGEVRGIAYIYERWIPRQQHIDGLFNVAWSGDRQDSIVATATATSHYTPVEIARLQGESRYRFLELDSSIDSNLCIVQRSKLLKATEIPKNVPIA